MEAFRKSLAAVQAETANDDGKQAKAARPKKSKAKVEGQREMLLPIAGGKNRGRSKACEGSAAEGGLTIQAARARRLAGPAQGGGEHCRG